MAACRNRCRICSVSSSRNALTSRVTTAAARWSRRRRRRDWLPCCGWSRHAGCEAAHGTTGRRPGRPSESRLASRRPSAPRYSTRTSRSPAGDLQLGGRVQSDDLAVDDESHPVAQFVGGRHVVRGEENRPPTRFEIQDHVLYLARVDRIQARCRFVEEKELRVVDQRPDERQAHLHSLGVLADSRVRVVGQPDGVEQRHRVQRLAVVQ